ncbi:15208_t:CDS:2 [Acaulospora morrowiae]|uniref:15208_t:CDS:1 n=1 Tax=Acaulospora morrowiae TaxID=94023 RepID=A0A9N9AAM7_9GLOM|nr:15208_t:CDS:2 [Acaulospora morrowiae]
MPIDAKHPVIMDVDKAAERKNSHTNLSQRCILAVGDTGLGKSFTAKVLGAEEAEIGNGTGSKTASVNVYTIKVANKNGENKSTLYIDTPGFADTNADTDKSKTDEETKRRIFNNMLKAGVTNLTTILWFVKPGIKADNMYKRQAEFIESLAMGYNNNNCNVWDNTIIVIKDEEPDTEDTVGGPSNAGSLTNADGPIQAAREIAQKLHNTEDDRLSKTRCFFILLFEKFRAKRKKDMIEKSSDELNKLGFYRENEHERIRKRYESLMENHIEHPICLNLKSVKCSKCSEKTDPRIAGNKCHSEVELIHPNIKSTHVGDVELIHSGCTQYYHRSHYVAATTKHVMDHNVIPWVVRIGTLGMANPTKLEFVNGYWSCCRNIDANSVGCQQRCGFCSKEITDRGCVRMYKGCKHTDDVGPCNNTCVACRKSSDTEGCTEKCKRCNKHNPSNLPGCSEVGHDNVEHDFFK